jgi:hypothetical protein
MEEADATLRDDLRQARKYFIVYAYGTFEDGFGKHWFRFCGWIPLPDVSGTFPSRKCTDYNETGDFPK